MHPVILLHTQVVTFSTSTGCSIFLLYKGYFIQTMRFALWFLFAGVGHAQ